MKYELTENTKEINDITLYQIKSLKDFGDVKNGDLGGWIEKESNLSQAGLCWVSGDAQVYGDAGIYDDAQVYNDARVYGNARVYENARISGDARVSGDAWVFGKAQVFGDAQVYGDAEVYGKAQVYGDARVFGKAWVSENSRVFGKARVYDDVRVFGKALVYENARVYDDARVFGKALVYGDVKLNIDVKSKSTTTKITAKDALELAKSKNSNLKVDNAVNTLLDRVKQAAEKGQYYIETRDYEFGSGKCYTSEENYPELCKQILQELKSLGFKCTVCAEENQFVDMWLEISWKDD